LSVNGGKGPTLTSVRSFREGEMNAGTLIKLTSSVVEKIILFDINKMGRMPNMSKMLKSRKFWTIVVVVLAISLGLGLGLGLGLKPSATVQKFGNVSNADIENQIATYINNQPDSNFYNYQVFLALKGYGKNGLYSKANYDKLYNSRPITSSDLSKYK